MIDKSQQEFEKHCIDCEDLDLDVHLPLAREAYWEAFNSEEVEHKKKNAGQRALNLHLLGELKKVGAHIWRKDSKQEVKQVSKVNIQNADTRSVAYKGNGTRPAHLTIKL